jgi:hypothetical protein
MCYALEDCICLWIVLFLFIKWNQIWIGNFLWMWIITYHLELCLISKNFQASMYTLLTNIQISIVCSVFTRHAPCTHLVLTIRVPNHHGWLKRVMKRFLISSGPFQLQFPDPGDFIWKVIRISNDEPFWWSGLLLQDHIRDAGKPTYEAT